MTRSSFKVVPSRGELRLFEDGSNPPMLCIEIHWRFDQSNDLYSNRQNWLW